MADQDPFRIYLDEQPLDPGNIAQVIRMRRNEIEDITYAGKVFEHEGILILEVNLPQRASRGSALFKNANLRVLVIGEEKKNHQMFTFRINGTKATYQDGADLTGTSASIEKKEISWCTGLQLKWKGGPRKADFKPAGVLKHRLAYLKSIGELFSGKNKDEEWEDVDWAGIREIIDKHQKFRDEQKGTALSVPAGYELDDDRRLRKITQAVVLSKSKTIFQTPKAALRAAEPAKEPEPELFWVDVYQQLSAYERAKAHDLLMMLEMDFRPFPNWKMDDLVKLINQAYPWHQICEQELKGYRDARDRDEVCRLHSWPPFRTWWDMARKRPETIISRKTVGGKGFVSQFDNLENLPRFLALDMKLFFEQADFLFWHAEGVYLI